MKIIIVGCGRVGANLADQLARQGHLVIVVDQQVAAFDALPLDFHGRTVVGDVLAGNVLHRAEIESADALAAVTASDSLNALVAHIARTEYGVRRVAARNCDPRQRLLQETFDIAVVGGAAWEGQRLEQILTDQAAGQEAQP